MKYAGTMLNSLQTGCRRYRGTLLAEKHLSPAAEQAGSRLHRLLSTKSIRKFSDREEGFVRQKVLRPGGRLDQFMNFAVRRPTSEQSEMPAYHVQLIRGGLSPGFIFWEEVEPNV